MFELKTKKDVLKVVKEKNVSFIQFWFTDVLGVQKIFSITPSELEEGMEEGMGFDGSSIAGLLPDRGERHDRHARSHHLPDHPLAALGPPGRADDLRHPESRRHPLRGRPPLCAEEDPQEGQRSGLHLLRRPRTGVSSISPPTRPPSSSTWAATSTASPWTGRPTCAARRSSPSRRWGSGWSTAITRWPRASTRSTCATTRPSRWPTRS